MKAKHHLIGIVFGAAILSVGFFFDRSVTDYLGAPQTSFTATTDASGLAKVILAAGQVKSGQFGHGWVFPSKHVCQNPDETRHLDLNVVLAKAETVLESETVLRPYVKLENSASGPKFLIAPQNLATLCSTSFSLSNDFVLTSQKEVKNALADIGVRPSAYYTEGVRLIEPQLRK